MKYTLPVSSEEDDLHVSVVGQRSVVSLMVLISRSLLMQFVALGGFFFLSAYLSIAEIGLFFAVNEIVAILGYFSDVGLAAALIQKQEKLELADIRTTFTIQQLLVTGLCLVVLLATPWIRNFFDLSQPGVWLLWSLVAGFFLSSLKTIPSVLLERKLKFDKLVIVETVETLAFYGLAVLLAWQGWGLLSYAVAVVARGLLGVIMLYILSPWQIGVGISQDSIKRLLKFGLPYQANTLIAALKDRLLNVILFKVIGAQGMGIIAWASTWSQKPLRFVSDNITKVTFPAFARLQSDQEKLTRGIEKMLFFSAVTIFPILVGIGVIAEPLIQLIPRYHKWLPALMVFYIYLFNSGWAAISSPITNTLAAIGQIKLVSKLMVMWTILTWGLVAPLGYWYGYNGVAIGVGLVALSSMVPIILLYRIIKFDYVTSIIKPLVASLAMGVLVLIVIQLVSGWVDVSSVVMRWLPLGLGISVGAFSYITLLELITGQQLVSQVKLFLKTAKNQK